MADRLINTFIGPRRAKVETIDSTVCGNSLPPHESRCCGYHSDNGRRQKLSITKLVVFGCPDYPKDDES